MMPLEETWRELRRMQLRNCLKSLGDARNVAPLGTEGAPFGPFWPRITAESALGAALFYSDGLVEAHDPQREMFGFPRLKALVARHGDDEEGG